VRLDTNDMISVTEASGKFSRLVTEAAGGRTFHVMKNNEFAAAIVGREELERLQRVHEVEEDLRLWTIALVRTITDDGERYDLDEVAREFGVDLDEED
jgi:antitoxin (DNA-binding transcriptional repressor) of toxin-antitoxin stability system